jgi:hypothetical protein
MATIQASFANAAEFFNSLLGDYPVAETPSPRPSPARGGRERTVATPYWNVMSRHLEMSEPRPEEMMMQPRTFCAPTSAAHTE